MSRTTSRSRATPTSNKRLIQSLVEAGGALAEVVAAAEKRAELIALRADLRNARIDWDALLLQIDEETLN